MYDNVHPMPSRARKNQIYEPRMEYKRVSGARILTSMTPHLIYLSLIKDHRRPVKDAYTTDKISMIGYDQLENISL